MYHLMIDLETLSTENNAIVTQLGWAMFDPSASEVAKSGVFHLNIGEQVKRGLDMSWDTVSWWFEQDEEARRNMVRKERISVDHALNNFSGAVADFQIVAGVWSHGAMFDLVVLANLYKAFDRKVPWNFRLARDTRTLFALAGKDFIVTPNPRKHLAEQDAIFQAYGVQRACRIIGAMFE